MNKKSNNHNKSNDQSSKVNNVKTNNKNAKASRVDDELGSDRSLFEPYSDNELSGTESESEGSDSSEQSIKKRVKKDDGNKGKGDKNELL